MHPSTTYESTDVVDLPSLEILKPPLPTLRARQSQQANKAEVQIPPLIAGALVAAFAAALADGLNNELLTHYYLPDQKVRVNIDRVLDRLFLEFTRQLWDELWRFYSNSNPDASSRVKLLFDGPISQIILILDGPEISRCLLDKLGPGLSRRPVTWSESAKGIDLQLSLQLLCGYWDREYPSRSPRGSPEEIARTLHKHITTGNASSNLVSRVRQVLLSPHYVQMHLMESAIWDIVLKRPYPPPTDGFHVVVFKFECHLFGPREGIHDQRLVNVGSLPAITGSANQCTYTTVSEYVSRHWPKCGTLLLNCLEEAVNNAWVSSGKGNGLHGMSVWDGMDNTGSSHPGLRLLHIEVESGTVNLSVSAYTHTLVQIFQQMAWTCATLSASPFPGSFLHCAMEISDWTYMNDSAFVSCSLAHHPVDNNDLVPWLRRMPGAVIASGFPITHSAAEA